MTIRIFRFVSHHEVDSFAREGWIDRDFSPGHHGCHSRVMELHPDPDAPVLETVRDEGEGK